ncbi:MAG: DUF6563 family protein [Bacteroides sp.]
MKRLVSILLLLVACFLEGRAQQVLFSNLKNLLEVRGDTVSTLHVERRSKKQIYLMGGADFKIEARGNEGLTKYIKRRCYAIQVDSVLYLNCRKMRYKRYRFGAWYAQALRINGHVFYKAQPLGQVASSTVVDEEATKLGGEVGDAINASGMVTQRVYYELDLTTGYSRFVGKERMTELLEGHPDWIEALQKEHSEEASVIEPYLLLLKQ